MLALGAGAVMMAPSGVRAAETHRAKSMRGVFIILNTPFTSAGAVDWDDLEREVSFVDRGGCSGIVWPQGSSSVGTLTGDERGRGMELLAKLTRGQRLTLVLGVQGKDTAEMLEYARRADALGTDAMIAMPPTTGTSMDDYRAYFRALGGATKRSVFVQTSGGARNLFPSPELIVELAREFPVLKGIFGASFSTGWLYEMRLGLDGVVSGVGMYADLMGRIWSLHEQGQHDAVRDAFSKFLLMRNLNESIPGTDLYVMKKRGVFKTTARRSGAPQPGVPPKVTELKLTPVEIEEIEYRFAALKPYLTL
jgi:dihydrodipicolinate synthase/N-acetylneuraminate lyase